MTHVSLFSGIGGIDLAAGWAGFRTILQVEKDPYCQKVLAKHWPEVKRIEDIRDVKADSVSEPVTLISGGFPCQPASVAGKRRGTGDDRWLWPEMFRVIQEIEPRRVLAENVPGLLSLESGMVFENMLTDLEIEGYETWMGLIPVAGVGAPHLRYRVFIVAHAEQFGRRGRNNGDAGWHGGKVQTARSGAGEKQGVLVDTECLWKLQPKGSKQDERGWSGDSSEDIGDTTGQRLSNRIAGTLEGSKERLEILQPQRSDWWTTEPDVGRVASRIPRRVDRLRCLGNAVVPAQVLPILRAIAEMEGECADTT